MDYSNGKLREKKLYSNHLESVKDDCMQGEKKRPSWTFKLALIFLCFFVCTLCVYFSYSNFK